MDESLPDSYESALKELETQLTRLETGQLTLEDALTTFQRGSILLNYCQNRLSDAEQRIRVLEGNTLQDYSA
ncbi:MAG: exodeoxyribonuclease VII small subunit [Betaproteobacteria bacterium]|jgi:Exodeoxyribonuclease VII small subunit (EC 3.1.11.6)|nr:exodeoxyribonuclease VII small subunit [Betaproteobacteria bacterium]